MNKVSEEIADLESRILPDLSTRAGEAQRKVDEIRNLVTAQEEKSEACRSLHEQLVDHVNRTLTSMTSQIDAVIGKLTALGTFPREVPGSIPRIEILPGWRILR